MKKTIKATLASRIAKIAEKSADVYSPANCAYRYYEPEIPVALREKENK